MQRWDTIVSAQPFTVSRSTFQANSPPLQRWPYSHVHAVKLAWHRHVLRHAWIQQAHLAPVVSTEEVQAVLATLLTNNKVQRATHNMMAYRIHISDRNTYLQVIGSAGLTLSLRMILCMLGVAFSQTAGDEVKGDLLSHWGERAVAGIAVKALPDNAILHGPQDFDDNGESAAGARLLKLLQIVEACNVVVVVSRWFGGTLLGPSRFTHINNAARQLLDECGYIKGKAPRQAARKR